MGNDVTKKYSDVISFTKKKHYATLLVFLTTVIQVHFPKFNVLPFHYNYQFNLAIKYKESVKRGHTAFIHLCNLSKPHRLKYDIRERETWAVPFSRTNRGKDRLPCQISILLNNLEKENVDLTAVSRQILQGYFISRAIASE